MLTTRQRKNYPDPERLVDELVEEESWRQVLTSLVLCLFVRGIYKPGVVLRALKPLGIEMDENELKELGRRIYREKLELKKMMGFDPSELRIPRRIFEVESPHGLLSEEYVREALEKWSRAHS
jgi:aldehyde:ferredoxin oxidoreductase